MTPAIDLAHPAWCDARHCDTSSPHSIHHCSTPINFRIENGLAEVEVSRSQYDGYASDTPTYHVRICRHDVEGESVEFEWTRRSTEHLLHVFDYLDGLN